MNKVIIALALFLTLSVQAAEPTCTSEISEVATTGQLVIKTDVPKYLKGAKITVTLADGRQTTVPAEMFKVVPRKQQFVTTATKQTTTNSCELVTNVPRRNRISALGGYGRTGGLDVTMTSPTQVEVENRTGLVGGLQYQRSLPLLDDRLSVGGQVQTNKAASLLLGIDF